LELKTLEELEDQLRRGAIRPIYLVLGPETFLNRQAIAAIQEKALSSDALTFNYTELSAQSASASEILEAANTFPLLSPRRLVIVTEIESLEAREQEQLLKYLDRPAEKTVLVLVAGELERRSAFYRTLREKACVIEFPKLKGTALERWADDYIRHRGFRTSSASLRKLVDLAGSDAQALVGEIEKLILYAGKVRQIPDAAVDELVLASRQHGVFELIGAVARRDLRAALGLLGNLLDSGEQPIAIVALMARHFRQVLIAKEMLSQGRNSREIMAAAQIPSWIVEDFLRQSRSFDLVTTKSLYDRLADADYRLKSSTVDGRMLLEGLICSL